jgi:hypothetical protein
MTTKLHFGKVPVPSDDKSSGDKSSPYLPSVLGYLGGKVGNDVKLVSQAGCADRRTE